MTDAEVRSIAKAAVREFLLELGVDATRPESILEVQKDFAHIRRWRLSADLARTVTIRTAFTVIVTGTLGLIAMWFSGK